MALQVQLPRPISGQLSRTPSTWTTGNHSSVIFVDSHRRLSKNNTTAVAVAAAASSASSSTMMMTVKVNKSRKNGSLMVVRSSLETAGPTVVVGQVTEVNKDTFWPLVNAAGDKAVVVDMYTQWCGPCKVMAPKFQGLSEKYLDVVFLKLDCNQENKSLAKELGIKVVPTFKIIKDNKIVKEVTGAKFNDLVVAIESVSSSSSG